MRNPEVFQGERKITTSKNYFEGWYFKNTSGEDSISFIPGMNINEQEQCAFIQVITRDNSYFVDYSIEDFEFGYDPFYVKIGNNFFSKTHIHIDIKDDNQNLTIYGGIKYSNHKNIDTSLLSSNIMGPFSYLSFMECNHAILSMKTYANGSITVNDYKIDFKDGTSYIEKDWGSSFPKSYIWWEGNNFENKNASFMISVADIPFKIFSFRGFICSLIVDDKEYRFATYNNARLKKYDIGKDLLDITLKKGSYVLNIQSKYASGSRLSAPVKGKMEKDILESISATVTITLKKKGEIIFFDTSFNCGLEIVK